MRSRFAPARHERRDDRLLEIGNRDVVREDVGQVRCVLGDGEAYVAPQLAAVAARVAVRRPARRRERLQLAHVVLLVIVEAAVGAELEIFVDRVHRRQPRAADRDGDRRRQRLGPTVNVHDRRLVRQRREQVAQRARRGQVPDALRRRSQLRRIADEVLLIEADGLDAVLGEQRGHRTRGSEDDRTMPRALEAHGRVEGHLSPGRR